MYNIIMKKISVLLIFLLFLAAVPCNAGALSNYKARVEQNRIYKSTQKQLEQIIKNQNTVANEHNIEKLGEFYSPNYVNSDGFNRDIYLRLIKETWETYPDITYYMDVLNVDFSDNYASILVKETAVSAPVEQFEELQTVAELFSESVSIYHLEKQGSKWFICSEEIIQETSSLKFGEARYMDMELNAPKQIGSNKDYTVTLKVNTPAGAEVAASIGKESIVYPQTQPQENFRPIYGNILERVFRSNSDNINEYAVASVGIAHARGVDEKKLEIYMTGLAFIMTRINVVPVNKFIRSDDNGQNK